MKFKTFVGFVKTTEGQPTIPIISVVAEDSQKGRMEIERQLREAGRKEDLNRWIKGGRYIGETFWIDSPIVSKEVTTNG